MSQVSSSFIGRNITVFLLTSLFSFLILKYSVNQLAGTQNIDFGQWFLIFIPLPLLGLATFQWLHSSFKRNLNSIILPIIVGVYVACETILQSWGLALLSLVTVLLIVYVFWSALSSFARSASSLGRKPLIFFTCMGLVLVTFPTLYFLFVFTSQPFSMGIL